MQTHSIHFYSSTHFRSLLIAILVSLGASASYARAPENRPSLIINDTRILDHEQLFSFKKTIKHIISSNPSAVEDDEVEKFLNCWWRTFGRQYENDCPVQGVEVPQPKVDSLASFDPTKFIDPSSLFRLSPIAIFTRFDLASTEFNDCGEFRIVYGFENERLKKKVDGKLKRLFFIFEARPILTINDRATACQKVAQFWRSLDNLEMYGKQRREHIARAVEKFFFDKDFKGHPLKGALKRGVFRHDYFTKHSQIRMNAKVLDDVEEKFPEPWVFREWRPNYESRGKYVTFENAPLKDSFEYRFLIEPPKTVITNAELAEFYKKLSDGDDAVLPDLTSKKVMPRVIRNSLDNSVSAEINLLGISPSKRAKIEEHFAEQAFIDGKLTGKVGEFSYTTLLEKGVGFTDRVKAKIAMNRLEAVSCVGCHQFSNDAKFFEQTPTTAGDGCSDSTWPDSLGFIHVGDMEKAQGAADHRFSVLSCALKKQFLPFRGAILDAFIDDPKDVIIQYVGNEKESNVSRADQIVELAKSIQERISAVNQPDNGGDDSLPHAIRDLRRLMNLQPGAFTKNRRQH